MISKEIDEPVVGCDVEGFIEIQQDHQDVGVVVSKVVIV